MTKTLLTRYTHIWVHLYICEHNGLKQQVSLRVHSSLSSTQKQQFSKAEILEEAPRCEQHRYSENPHRLQWGLPWGSSGWNFGVNSSPASLALSERFCEWPKILYYIYPISPELPGADVWHLQFRILINELPTWTWKTKILHPYQALGRLPSALSRKDVGSFYTHWFIQSSQQTQRCFPLVLVLWVRSSDSNCSAFTLPKGSVCPDGHKDVFRDVDQSYPAMEHLEGQASSLDLLAGNRDGLGAVGMRWWVSLSGEESQVHLLWVDSKIMHVKFIGLQFTSHPWVLAPRTYARVGSGNLTCFRPVVANQWSMDYWLS